MDHTTPQVSGLDMKYNISAIKLFQVCLTAVEALVNWSHKYLPGKYVGLEFRQQIYSMGRAYFNVRINNDVRNRLEV